MLNFENKIFLESLFCLQKLNEEGACLKQDNSFLQELLNYNEVYNKDEKEDLSISLITSDTLEKEQREENSIDLTTAEVSKISHLDYTDEINFDSFYLEYIDSNQNMSNNYDVYVDRVIYSLRKFNCLSNTFSKEVIKRSIRLPNTHKKTLILDLDETLVHCEFNSFTNVKHDIVSFYDEETKEEVKVFVSLRPNVREFLINVKEYFDIALFTASIKPYADAVISLIDPSNEIFSFKLYRESCIKVGKAYIKDLRIINREMSSLIIVDNSLYSFANQLSNGVLISSFLQ